VRALFLSPSSSNARGGSLHPIGQAAQKYPGKAHWKAEIGDPMRFFFCLCFFTRFQIGCSVRAAADLRQLSAARFLRTAG
jgi:hypothetical protein